MKSIAFSILVIGAAAADAAECRYEARREAALDAAGATAVFVHGEAGGLRVEGQPGLREVRVEGRACASSQELLERTRVRAEKSGGQLRVVAEVPDSQGWGWRDGGATLDLVVRVPESLRVEIEDGSGSLQVSRVGALSIADGSGEVEIEDVNGDLRIRDGSGSIRARNIAGSVTIEADGSGGIELRDVRGSVVVEEDGSGGIDVEDVGGDLRVSKGGSGGVQHANVRGQVSVPGRGRHRRR
jgi:hypothetical protein